MFPSLTIGDGKNLVCVSPTALMSLTVTNGTFTVRGGSLSTGAIKVNRQGKLNFPSGTIRTGTLMVTNGCPQHIGDGTNHACLSLSGPTGSGEPSVSTFSGGLVVETNSEIVASGNVVIVGNVTNYGTISITNGTLRFRASDQYPSSLTSYGGLAATNSGLMVMPKGAFST